MTLLTVLLDAERELKEAKARAKAAKHARDMAYVALLSWGEAHWHCEVCGSTETPENQGEPHQACSACGNRRVRMVGKAYDK